MMLPPLFYAKAASFLIVRMDISELLKDSYKKTIVIASNIIQGDSSHFISCYKLCNQGNLQIAARAARVIDECRT